ncbi:polysaccharide biosynthesis/export family protein [Microvirga sp. 3-52]|nr:polysaccharide biosynthesis/export family protein [Microvirga sp. 3-52]
MRVKVVEWRAGKNEFYEWSSLGGEYSIATSGNVLLPFLGEIPAEGKTIGELSNSIAGALQKRVGLTTQPAAAVEIVQFRPVYVIGDVEKPGEYSFRPGLTVLQAVGLAGGERRTTETGLLRLERDRITAQASVQTTRNDLRRAYARRSRLRSELAGADQIEIPKELANDADTAILLAGEKGIMLARREGLRAQRDVLKKLKELLSSEISSLDKKIVVQNKQLTLAREELSKVSSLVDRGLTVSSREFTLERTVADLEGRFLDLETAVLRAKQGINAATQKEVSLESDWRRDLMVDLQQAEAKIEELTTKFETARSLLHETTVTAPLLAAERWKRDEWKTSYMLVRGSGGNAEKIPTNESALLRAGDVVQVTLQNPEEAPVASAKGEESKLVLSK